GEWGVGSWELVSVGWNKRSAFHRLPFTVSAIYHFHRRFRRSPRRLPRILCSLAFTPPFTDWAALLGEGMAVRWFWWNALCLFHPT
uniref:hypothetical protein n=1 Tax=uncultured Deefgea sp. TaxID=1304914 RepID=UPI0025944237